ncbi:lysosomal thioesterase PPT2-A-like isoform X2 [Apostichopus japonicus]
MKFFSPLDLGFFLASLLNVIYFGSCYRLQASTQYRPVVIIHGVLDNAGTMNTLQTMIQKAHPGTNVTALNLYPDEKSLKPLWPQVKDFGDALIQIMKDAQDGINIICYSQGGVICRGVLSTIPDHNVNTFIALSSPLMGQFGDTNVFKFVPPEFRKEIYKFCYESIGQDHLSVCQYWNDPQHQDLFIEKSIFLAVLNNQTTNVNSTEWKKNFIRIKNLVMISGPDDGVITPWQSSHFAFFDEELNIVEMENQMVYKEDYFGLQTLHKRGALQKCIMSGVEHTHWHSNQTVFDNCIEPWLG